MLLDQVQLQNSKFKLQRKEMTESQSVIQTPVRNLSNKLDSILRSIQNLTAKKLRIEYEIKKQKASLSRKRSELKRAQKSTSRRIRISLESNDPDSEKFKAEELQSFQKQISKLLEESARVLDEP